ncbi:hypothetical protein PanWU01x14_091630 [Parasponia andersonii]|uniref:Uncharacterized protein n=1 Tax=Parasponia andersonii TaxID=3476 RepID=A0A2P5D7D4_PARAD|nr:hypothetical protein PanWU01x14_091630 [Parasponia andersonii]
MGLLALWLKQVKIVVLSFSLKNIHNPTPPTLLQRLVVSPTSLLQEILLRHKNHHPIASHFNQVRVMKRVHQRVHRPTVRRENVLQQLVPLVAVEVRVKQDQPDNFGPTKPKPIHPGP